MMTDRTSEPTRGPALSPREREVLDLLRRRRTNAEIATHLGLNVRTVEHHVSRILAKLKVANRRDAGSLITDDLAPSPSPSPSHEPRSLDGNG